MFEIRMLRRIFGLQGDETDLDVEGRVILK
jgi:hypothetical protein